MHTFKSLELELKYWAIPVTETKTKMNIITNIIQLKYTINSIIAINSF